MGLSSSKPGRLLILVSAAALLAELLRRVRRKCLGNNRAEDSSSQLLKPPEVSPAWQVPPPPSRLPPPLRVDKIQQSGIPERPARPPPAAKLLKVPAGNQGDIPTRPIRLPPAAKIQGEINPDASVVPPHPRRPPPLIKLDPMSPAALGIDLFVCIDFEWTCDEGEVRQVRGDNVEIIEFAFVVYDARVGREVCQGQHYCKNDRTPITEFCTRLTGISEQTLASAGSLGDALAAFEEAMQAKDLAGRPCCAVAHGSADLELILPMHCRALGLKVPRVFEQYIDLRLATQRHVASRGIKGVRASSLKEISEALGLETIGQEHCGLDDAWMVLMATQQLLKAGADLQIVDIAAEHEAFMAGEIQDSRLCLDGLPYFSVASELRAWFSKQLGTDDVPGAESMAVVLGRDNRPSQRALADFGTPEAARRALKALHGGRLLVCEKTAFRDHAERLLLVRPLRRDEITLPTWTRLPKPESEDTGPALLCPFPGDAEVRSWRGVCFAFQRGECPRGDGCRYAHEAGGVRRRRPCFNFQKGMCNRGVDCMYAHE
eukprot:TRINITY_DN24761_c0_g1_i1.p1 TRINITY_DN24761_c0_g1~~TRINITY_DN24761_c0_g1_i1.p1  ORF type:complete len:546 (+),score=88.75 TRINITY_DN24761_c0_g1_i1:50-1687(+)